VVEHLPSKYKVLGLISNTTRKKIKKKWVEIIDYFSPNKHLIEGYIQHKRMIEICQSNKQTLKATTQEAVVGRLWSEASLDKSVRP
jgi:hypothetical protein